MGGAVRLPGGIAHAGADRAGARLRPQLLVLAAAVRPCLLRHRDDGSGRVALRHVPVRHGGHARFAAPGRRHDRRRLVQHQDGSAGGAPLRADPRSQVGAGHGVVRHLGQRLGYLQHRAGHRQPHPGGRVRARLPAPPRSSVAGTGDDPGAHQAEQARLRRAAPHPRPRCARARASRGRERRWHDADGRHIAATLLRHAGRLPPPGCRRGFGARLLERTEFRGRADLQRGPRGLAGGAHASATSAPQLAFDQLDSLLGDHLPGAHRRAASRWWPIWSPTPTATGCG